MMIFHTSFNEEFCGNNAREVIRKLYENSKRGMGDISFESWWLYQRKIWKMKYGVNLPEEPIEGAHEVLLDFFVDVGALNVGSLPGD